MSIYSSYSSGSKSAKMGSAKNSCIVTSNPSHIFFIVTTPAFLLWPYKIFFNVEGGTPEHTAGRPYIVFLIYVRYFFNSFSYSSRNQLNFYILLDTWNPVRTFLILRRVFHFVIKFLYFPVCWIGVIIQLSFCYRL